MENNKNMKKLALFGSGDFAQSIIPLALSTGEYEIFGYFEDYNPKGTVINGYIVYGAADDAVKMYQEGAFDCIFIAMGYNHFDIKEKVYLKFKGTIPLATIITPDVTIDKSAIIGEGTCVCLNSLIGKGCIIGDNVWICDSTISHNIIVGNHTYFSGGNRVAGFSNIGKKCFFGICAIVSEHLSITDDVWIGLGMIVYKSIKKSGKYAVLQKIVQLG